LRYSKELQANVCKDVSNGVSPADCAKKYGIPIGLVVRWNGLEVSEQRASEIALRKYQVEVSETEAVITDKISNYLSKNISDDEYFRICDSVSKMLYKLVASVIQKERQLNPSKDKKTDVEIIADLTMKWRNNKFIKAWKILKGGLHG